MRRSLRRAATAAAATIVLYTTAAVAQEAPTPAAGQPAAARPAAAEPAAARPAAAEPAAGEAPSGLAPSGAAEIRQGEEPPAAHHGSPETAGHEVQGAHGAEEAHGAAAHGGGHAAGHGEHDAPGAINWFDFSNKEQPPYGAYFINFALLVFVYVRFGKKPVAEGLQKRRETVMKDIEEASRMEAEARERAKTYQAKLVNLGTESEEARSAIVHAGEGEKQRMLQEARDKAERLRRDVEFLLQQEAKEVREQLQRETVDAAAHGALELLRRSVTPQDHQRFAEEYLKSLEKMAIERAQGGAS